jgi:hypothetical protein
MGADFSKIGPFLIAALAVFIIYRRLRRSFGQQPLQRVRMQARMIILLIIGCLLLPVAWRSTEFLSAVLAGVAAGVALALWGAARTRFLKIDQQLYYVPHTYTGIAVHAAKSADGRVIFRGSGLLRLLLQRGAAEIKTSHCGRGSVRHLSP